MGKGTGVCDRPALELGVTSQINNAALLDRAIFARAGLWFKTPKDLALSLQESKLSVDDITKRLEKLYQEGYFYKHFTKTYTGSEDAEVEVDYRFTELGRVRRAQETLKELTLPAQDILGALGELNSPNQAKVAANLGMNRKICADAFRELLAKDLIERDDKNFNGVCYDLSDDGNKCREEMMSQISPWGAVEESSEQATPAVVINPPVPDLPNPKELGLEALEALQEQFSQYNYYKYPTSLSLANLTYKLGTDQDELEAQLDSLLGYGGVSKTVYSEISLEDNQEHQRTREVHYQVNEEAKEKLKPEILKRLTEDLPPRALEVIEKVQAGDWRGFDLESLAEESVQKPEEFLEALVALAQRGYLEGRLTLSRKAPRPPKAAGK